MRLGIVGSRGYPRMDLVRAYVDSLPPDTVVVSGTEPNTKDPRRWGVDEVAIDQARKRGLQTSVWPAQWEQYGKKAGYLRNVDIIGDSDSVAAFWDGVSKGTGHSVNLTRQAGKPLLIVSAEGTWSGWE